jgi:hypothetical protein
MGRHFMAVVLGVAVALFSWEALGAQEEGLEACDDLPDWPAPQTTINGDVDGNQKLELTDAVYLLGFLFQGGPPPAPLGCGESHDTAVLSWWQNGDVNGDWKLDLGDAVSLLIHLFRSGAPPVASCEHPSPVFPPESRPYGLSYGEWSAIWWRWQLCIPVSDHPARGGPHVAQSQPVFFLAGAFVSEEVPRRSFRVPAGKPILLAIITGECSTLEVGTDWFCEDDATCRDCASRATSPGDELGCTIARPCSSDGVAVNDLHSFRAASPSFQFTLPDDDILGVDGREGLSAADGYYLLLPPGVSGSTLCVEWFGKFVEGPGKGFLQDITYTLTFE